jgi:hypothetical protein
MDFRDRESVPDKRSTRWLIFAGVVTVLWLLVVVAAVFTYFWGTK